MSDAPNKTSTFEDMLISALKPIIKQALGMKSRADHGTVIRLTADEINAGKDALIAVGAWDFRMWENQHAPE